MQVELSSSSDTCNNEANNVHDSVKQDIETVEKEKLLPFRDDLMSLKNKKPTDSYYCARRN